MIAVMGGLMAAWGGALLAYALGLSDRRMYAMSAAMVLLTGSLYLAVELAVQS